MNRIRTLAASLLAVGLCVSGCSTNQSTPAPAQPTSYELPKLIQYNYRWSAEPGIDLFGVPETAVRAYLESYYIASFAHSTEAGYPGYEDATLDLGYGVARRDINDRTNFLDRPRVGTFYAHILSMAETDLGVQAIVCEGKFALSTSYQDGTFVTYGGRIPHVALIDLVPGPETVSQGSRTGEGPSRAPQTDMFGGWTVTRHAFSTGDYNDNLTCESKFPDPPETRPQRISETLTTPYPTLPPHPGWPEPTP